MVTTRIYTVLLAVMLLVALPAEVVPGNAMRRMQDAVICILSGYPLDSINNPWLCYFPQELLDAVRNGDLEVVQAMLFARDNFGRDKIYLARLLNFATEYRCFSSIRYLIEHGAGFGTTSLSDRVLAFEDFITTLDGAIQSNDMATMQSLVVGASRGEKTVALQWASHHGYLAAVQCLVENGASIPAGRNDLLAEWLDAEVRAAEDANRLPDFLGPEIPDIFLG
ncbi:ankyrin repeat domain-containing protein [Candidatus Dependentiae bacterium]|nr:ankyrin repeat domain-containing protein [Candidatus Dependentiae bacterium]